MSTILVCSAAAALLAPTALRKCTPELTALLRLPPPTMELRDLVGKGGYKGLVSQEPLAPDTSITVQGGSLRTWSCSNPSIKRMQVSLSSEGRPVDAEVELWQGPDYTPVKMRVYSEDGNERPFSAVMESPRGPSTVSIRNLGPTVFPFAASVATDSVASPLVVFPSSFSTGTASSTTTIQGGALRTYHCDPTIESVRVLFTSDGRPLNARLEVLQGPNNNKQVIELYSDDGLSRPLLLMLDTPDQGSVVRIVNTAPMEFPLAASIAPIRRSLSGTEALRARSWQRSGSGGWGADYAYGERPWYDSRVNDPYQGNPVDPYRARYNGPYRYGAYDATSRAQYGAARRETAWGAQYGAPYAPYAPYAPPPPLFAEPPLATARERVEAAKAKEEALTEAARRAREEADTAAEVLAEAERLEAEAAAARERAIASAQAATADAARAALAERQAAAAANVPLSQPGPEPRVTMPSQWADASYDSYFDSYSAFGRAARRARRPATRG